MSLLVCALTKWVITVIARPFVCRDYFLSWRGCVCWVRHVFLVAFGVNRIHCVTVEPLISWQSHDSISTVLCHSISFNSPNKQGGATVEIGSRDCQDMRGPSVLVFLHDCWSTWWWKTIFYHASFTFSVSVLVVLVGVSSFSFVDRAVVSLHDHLSRLFVLCWYLGAFRFITVAYLWDQLSCAFTYCKTEFISIFFFIENRKCSFCFIFNMGILQNYSYFR